MVMWRPVLLMYGRIPASTVEEEEQRLENDNRTTRASDERHKTFKVHQKLKGAFMILL